MNEADNDVKTQGKTGKGKKRKRKAFKKINRNIQVPGDPFLNFEKADPQKIVKDNMASIKSNETLVFHNEVLKTDAASSSDKVAPHNSNDNVPMNKRGLKNKDILKANANEKPNVQVKVAQKNVQGTINTIEPRQRGYPIKKERIGEVSRNIHTILDHTAKTQQQGASKTPELTSDIYSSDFVAPVQPVQSLPRGIPMSFLARQNIGAIRPQQVPHQMQMQPVMAQIQNANPYNTMANTYAPGHLPNPYPYYPSGEMFVNLEDTNVPKEQYSPTEAYDEVIEEVRPASESPDALENKQKRLSAFQRLGPQTQPKKPKLTINLCLNRDQETREVIEIAKSIPVHEREDIINSTDATVVKHRDQWPWKKTILTKRSVTARSSKTVMMMEKEQIEEDYSNNVAFIIVAVKGYPPSWTKENVIDTLLENIKGSSFIPCFIEFTQEQCKFLVNRCRPALLALHHLGFSIRKGDVELMITITVTLLNTKQLSFIPRLVLRNRLDMCIEDGKGNLSGFTLSEDVSHFIYFPLNRLSNQRELMDLLQFKDWNNLQELDLSYNRLTSLQGFDLLHNTPHLKHLNVSYNHFETIKVLMPCRDLTLRSLVLEGNPMCLNYVDGDYYVKVARTMFPSLRVLDGVPITLKGDIPSFKRNYCPKDAKPIAERFLGVFFRLLDKEPEDRVELMHLYHKNAALSITCKRKLRYDQDLKDIRNLFLRVSSLEEDKIDIIEGPDKIVKLYKKWPNIQHDPTSFTLDVLQHDENTTLLRIGGILRLTSTSLAEDEHLIAFTRTVLLVNSNGVEYKIGHEMLFWDEPTKEYARSAFKKALVQNKISLNFDTPLDDETKESLINIFMKLTELKWEHSKKCLEEKNWDLKNALDYFMKLLKLDNIAILKV
ncbi:uncharacterized protein LOC119832765 isoform X2 [Zerene cesonia]|uniref:uncharacterized protein LOC119832765 isoform X2 n=1 Tax=Zerene cesonia TaxID=33412 RepID=UPI0018E518AD|nr:uncharacterized protein LOC119832765 isoform X2 [Zerene cesonia]